MESPKMYEIDDKDLAIIGLTLIAFLVLFYTGKDGLDVIINIVCGLGGLVTGKGLAGKQ
jgi:hypothetical protein